MVFNQLKTIIFISVLSGVAATLGYIMGGSTGILYALIISLIINGITYWYSDSIALRVYSAQPLPRAKYQYVYDITAGLAERMHIPTPKLFLVKNPIANAFATGRSPATSSIAVTQGILELLDEHELRGVLAHELSHIKNRDILIGTMAVVLATAIGYMSDMIRWSIFWGQRGNRKQKINATSALLIAIITPIAATLIQLAISRTREYAADETGAQCSNDPLALASALEKIQLSTRKNMQDAPSNAHAAVASLFIVYPFTGRSLLNLFSTHPPIEKRIELL